MQQEEQELLSSVSGGFFTHMPDELTSNILSFLNMRDLCQMAQTCRKMRELAQSRTVLSKVAFDTLWPRDETKTLFARAADAGNLEAALKVGVACLYGKGVESDADTALKYLSQAEMLCAGAAPFVWLLFRPPWTSNQCSKACVFSRMKEKAQDVATDPTLAGRMYFCVAKTIALQEDKQEADVVSHLKRAELLHCADATYELFKRDPSQYANSEKDCFYRERQLLETARECPRLRFEVLCHFVDNHEIYEPKKKELFRETIDLGLERPACPSDAAPPQQPELDKQGKMRFILVDWLLEVASLKMYSIETLYCAVDMVDRFLATRTITRRTLQLLGITCMVVAARFLEQDVVTIREAAWLTENTYDYEHVVQMVSSVLAVMQGRVRRPSPTDYVRLFAELCSVPQHIRCFMDYVAETCLLHQSTLRFPPASLGAAIFYLSMHLVGCKSAWPSVIPANTDLRVSRFQQEIEEVYLCLFEREKITDHRGFELRAVEDRYSRALEACNLTHLRVDLAEPGIEAVKQSVESHIRDEHRRVRSSAQTPTPPLPKFTGIPLCEITNVRVPPFRAP